MVVVLRTTVGSVFSHVWNSIWGQINQAAVYQKPPLGALRGPWTACQSPRQSASRPLPAFELIITGRLSLARPGPAPEPTATSQTAVYASPALMLILTNDGRFTSRGNSAGENIYGNWKASLPFLCPLWPLFIHFHKLLLELLVFISLSDSPGFPLEFERVKSVS